VSLLCRVSTAQLYAILATTTARKKSTTIEFLRIRA
jgi:hypothetical protein